MPTKQGKKASPKADKQVAPEFDLSGKARKAPRGFVSPAQTRISFRRNTVAQLYLTGGHTIDTICEHLLNHYGYKIHRTVIAEDLKFLRKQWAENAALTTAEHQAKELDKLQALEVWCMDRLREGVFSPEKFAQEVVRLMKRRHSILGLDKTKLEVTDRRLEDLSDAELAAIAAGRKADSDAA
jgi:hypothetical protein